ncbi:hypothetical protein QTP88_027600 [Uroleucon formosanum]
MSEVNKRKRKRDKVECLECGSQFNDDLKKKHEEKLHRGKRVNIKHVGAPKNPFESAAAIRNLNKRAMIPENNCSSSSVRYNDAEKRFKDKSEDKSDSTVQTLQTVQTKIVDSKFEKNDSLNSSVINNNNDEKLSKDKSDSTVQKDNVDSKSENCQQVIEHNIDENSEEISWLLCAEGTLPNPIMFMLESQQVINRIKLKSECFLKNAKDLLDNLSDPSDHIQSVSKPNYFVEHDPGRRCDITSSSQRQYLLSLGPHQPKLLKYPINSDIDPSKQKSFNPIWLKEYPMLEYSLITDSAYCFVCSLFPKGLGRQFSNEAWVKQGINKWQKMKSPGKAKLGKLEQHFNSLSHKAALNDYRNFMKESNHIDIIMNKSKRQESIKLVQEKEFNKQIIIILFDIVRTLCRQGLSFRGDNEMVTNLIFNVTYLGPRSQNEFIDILSNEVRRIIVREVQEASLFSVMADTTPDNSHKDRLAICLRYVNNNGKAIERLLEIAEGVGKTGLGTAKQIIEILTQHSLGTDNLVFQSYDYASNISGQFNGTQAKLSELVGHSVFYIPCQAHRMNIFLEHACNSSLIVSDMIDNLENLYVFFSASNKRYSVLNKQMDNVDNTLHTYSWSARFDACHALFNSYAFIIEALHSIVDNQKEKAVYKVEASGLLARLKTLEIELYNGLENYFVQIRDDFDVFENKAVEITGCSEYAKDSKRKKKRKTKELECMFPNLEIVMCMYLSTAVSNCSGKRAFSVLKRVKSYLRSTMKEERLNALAIFSIEAELVEKLDFNDTINTFAHQKARKRKV